MRCQELIVGADPIVYSNRGLVSSGVVAVIVPNDQPPVAVKIATVYLDSDVSHVPTTWLKLQFGAGQVSQPLNGDPRLTQNGPSNSRTLKRGMGALAALDSQSSGRLSMGRALGVVPAGLRLRGAATRIDAAASRRSPLVRWAEGKKGDQFARQKTRQGPAPCRLVALRTRPRQLLAFRSLDAQQFDKRLALHFEKRDFNITSWPEVFTITESRASVRRSH
jgi:hypothetical protein